jgi:antitoxin FitA
MSQLIVRRVSPRLVRALKQRAGRAGRSAEAEHRAILEAALMGEGPGRDFKTFLRAVPEHGVLRLRRSKDRGRPTDL